MQEISEEFRGVFPNWEDELVAEKSPTYTYRCVTSYTLRGVKMATNLALDDRLIEEARRIGGHMTKKEAVTAALDEYIRRRKQQTIVKLFGMVEYERGYDHKANRRRDRIEHER